jgi:restriction system protein
MVVPHSHSIIVPFLKVISDGKDHRLKDLKQKLAEHFHLKEKELNVKDKKSGRSKFENNVDFVKQFHAKKAKLIKSISRGYFKITERGLDVLQENPDFQTYKDMQKFLSRYPEYIDWWKKNKSKTIDSDVKLGGNTLIGNKRNYPNKKLKKNVNLPYEQEGDRKIAEHLKTDRSPRNRRLVFQSRKTPEICEFCKQNTNELYGKKLSNLITQVHHMIPLQTGRRTPQEEDFIILNAY